MPYRETHKRKKVGNEADTGPSEQEKEEKEGKGLCSSRRNIEATAEERTETRESEEGEKKGVETPLGGGMQPPHFSPPPPSSLS